MFQSTVRFTTNEEDKIILSRSEPEVTCENGFVRFWFPDDNETVLLNSSFIVSIKVIKIEEKENVPTTD